MTAHEVSMAPAGRWGRDVFGGESLRDRLRQAEQLGRQHPDWMIWLGRASGCFDAMHPHVPEIVQARTAAEMAEKIRGWELANGRIISRHEAPRKR